MSTTIISVHRPKTGESVHERFAVSPFRFCHRSAATVRTIGLIFGIVIFAAESSPSLHAGKLGFLSLTPELQASATYNSNINTSATNALDDFIVHVRLQVSGNWAMTRYNSLDFRLGAGYQHYFKNTQLNRTRLTTTIVPDMNLEFSIRVTDYLQIQVVESLELRRDPTDSVGVDESGNFVFDALQYDRLINNVSMTANWDMNPRTASQLSLRRQDVFPLDDIFDSTRQIQWIASANIRRQFGSRYTGGLTYTYTDNRYQRSYLNNGVSHYFGPNFTAQVTPNITLATNLGYSWQKFDRGGEIGDNSDPKSVIWGLEMRHTPDPRLTYVVSTSRTQQFGLTANSTYMDRYGVSAIWTGFRISDVRLSFSRDEGRDSGGLLAEDYYRHVFGVGLSHDFGPNLGASFQYRYSVKVSSDEFRDYRQHTAVLNLTYRF